MKIPVSWIKDYVDINIDTDKLCDIFTLSGTKVDGVEKQGDKIKNVFTGRILEVTPHPDADKLRVTKVTTGDGEVQIVTGAPNITEESVGKIVPVALVGAELPDGKKISKGKLRGVESCGMLCSVDELDLDPDEYPNASDHGIWILPDETPIGIDMRDYLKLTDTIIDFEITPNRPDCLSVLGVAREASALLAQPFRKPTINLKEDGVSVNELVSVEVLDYELCPRYAARVVTDVKIGPSPAWMQSKLKASGIRAINNIVDITNFVMLETGQPMHGFDLDKIADSKIIVRRAASGEKVVTLDDKERTLNNDMLVISDANSAIAVAGIMGCGNSEVDSDTTTILFESAIFNRACVRRGSKHIGIRTESSGRFEKGLDLETTIYALDRAAMLVEMIGAGRVCKDRIDCVQRMPEKKRITFNPQRINQLLGTNIPTEQMVDILVSFEFEFNETVSEVIVPIFRQDVEIEADIIEEIARHFDYNNIKPTLLEGKATTVGGRSYEQKIRKNILDTVLSCGYSEIYTYSFISPKEFDKLNLPQDDTLRNAVQIKNPLGEDFSIMRTTTLASMLECLSINYNRRAEDVRLFEMANVYIPSDQDDEQVSENDEGYHKKVTLPVQIPMLTIGAYGDGADYYEIKGVCEEVFDKLKIKKFNYEPVTDNPTFHPGKTAAIYIKGELAGIIGEIHPLVVQNYECGKDTIAAYLLIDVLIKNSSDKMKVKPLPKFPAVTRDIAMVVDDGISAGKIDAIVKNKAGQIFESLKLFDVYKGEQLKSGTKSIAYSIIFRSPDRTLTDDEVNKSMDNIYKALKEKLGAELR